jgi:hypothetical protein
VFAAESQSCYQQVIPLNKGIFIFSWQTQHVGNHADRNLAGKLFDDFQFPVIDKPVDNFMRNGVYHRQKILQLLADKLSCNYVSKPAMFITITVFEDVGTEDMA